MNGARINASGASAHFIALMTSTCEIAVAAVASSGFVAGEFTAKVANVRHLDGEGTDFKVALSDTRWGCRWLSDHSPYAVWGLLLVGGR